MVDAVSGACVRTGIERSLPRHFFAPADAAVGHTHTIPRQMLNRNAAASDISARVVDAGTERRELFCSRPLLVRRAGSSCANFQWAYLFMSHTHMRVRERCLWCSTAWAFKHSNCHCCATTNSSAICAACCWVAGTLEISVCVCRAMCPWKRYKESVTNAICAVTRSCYRILDLEENWLHFLISMTWQNKIIFCWCLLWNFR